MDNIFLKTKRTAITSRQCAYSGCNERVMNRLHKVNIVTRYDVIMRMGIYIPPRALVCDFHNDYKNWMGVQNIATLPYTLDQINEMIDLLRLDKESVRGPQPGEF